MKKSHAILILIILCLAGALCFVMQRSAKADTATSTVAASSQNDSREKASRTTNITNIQISQENNVHRETHITQQQTVVVNQPLATTEHRNTANKERTSSSSSKQIKVTDRSSISSEVKRQADYILQAGDLILVQIFQEKSLTREIFISDENTITLPLIGTVEIGGKTTREAESIIRDLYAQSYLVNPQVSVIVLNTPKTTVSILGAVNAPGPILFPKEKGLTLMEAIAGAGGFTRYAGTRSVRITRILPSGETKVFAVDVEKIIRNESENIPLQLNDTIYVPEDTF